MKQFFVNIWQFATNNIWILWVLLVVVFLLVFMAYVHKSQQVDEYKSNNDALKDTLHTARDQNNQQTATIQAFKVTHVSDLHQIVTKDSTVNTLIRYVDSLQKAKVKIVTATVIKTVTIDAGSSKTSILNKPINLNDSVKMPYWPVYFIKWNEKWSAGSITATKDSITRNIHFYNEYETNVGYTRKNIFHSWIPTVMFKNLNPYSSTTDMRSVIVEPKANRWGLGGSLLGTIIGGKVRPVVGIGINYNVATF